MLKENYLVDMLLKLSDGELKMKLNIGYVLILGMNIGEIKELLKY